MLTIYDFVVGELVGLGSDGRRSLSYMAVPCTKCIFEKRALLPMRHAQGHRPEMRYCKISKEMSSLYFGLDVFGQFKARPQNFYAVFSVESTLYSPQMSGKRGCVSSSRTLASNRQSASSPKYNDDISSPISEYLISGIDDVYPW